jgi:DNA gyrase subunit B
VTEAAPSYGANDLQALEGLEAVRKRPGMYIGSTDTRGRTHLVYEILDNAVDEALAGHCTHITLTFHADGSVEVADNGRGIPTDINTKSGLSGVALVMTKLHAGGKFGGSGYKVAGGLHGVGASVTNALSTRVDVTVRRAGKVHEINFHRGDIGEFTAPGPDAKFKPGRDLRVTGKYTAKEGTGTTVRFWPDAAIFLPDSFIDTEAVIERAKRTAFLVAGLTVEVRNATGAELDHHLFKFDGGIADMVDAIAPDKAINETLQITGEGTFKENVPLLDEQGHLTPTEVERNVEVNVAFRWGVGYDTTIESFVNIVRTPDGGTHRSGFEKATVKALNEAIKSTRGLLKPKEDSPVLDDMLEGLTAVITVNVPEPQFVGQTKEKLGTAGVAKIVQTTIEQGLKAWVNGKKSKPEARIVLGKIVDASRVRLTQKAQKETARRKTALEGGSMPAKLVDCRSNGVARSELFIVEGDSALGSARTGRSAEYQALLPIRGKILNVHKATMTDILKNAEVASIIQTLGAGSGRTFDVSAMRYGRVMLMADADTDGSHIRCLLVVLFHKLMRPVIEEGMLYAAMPPLHKITTKGRSPETIFTYTEAEMKATVAKLEKSGKQIVTPVPRFKGLGEMDASELWDTTMNPADRSVRRITMEDTVAAEEMLELSMGAKVEPRRDWLVESAHQISRDAIDA